MSTQGAPVCRLCRREGVKLYLKGDKCFSRKCLAERRQYAPGQHGQGRQGRQRKLSDYGVQLREKQKMRRFYGVRERQFRNYMKEAIRRRGVTGEILLQLLEMRLDNVVHRLGIAASRAQARQFVNHGHILVNGRKVNIKSYIVKPGETIEVTEAGRSFAPILASIESSGGRVPTWLQFDSNRMIGTILSAPIRDEIDTDVQESLIVEFYSR